LTTDNNKQFVHNPITGEMMEASIYTGKEMLWREQTNTEKQRDKEINEEDNSLPVCPTTGNKDYWIRGT
jgi:hypothetical protein